MRQAVRVTVWTRVAVEVVGTKLDCRDNKWMCRKCTYCHGENYTVAFRCDAYQTCLSQQSSRNYMTNTQYQVSQNVPNPHTSSSGEINQNWHTSMNKEINELWAKLDFHNQSWEEVYKREYP